MASEPLIRLKLHDGTFIDFYRTDNNEVHVCRDGHCVILPHGTGQQTVDFLALLEPLGTIEEVPDGTT